jgi:hypothetical protein
MRVLTSKVKEAMRKQPCRTCGASPGSSCRTSNGSVTTEHADRYRQACEVGDLPIDITEYYAS